MLSLHPELVDYSFLRIYVKISQDKYVQCCAVDMFAESIIKLLFFCMLLRVHLGFGAGTMHWSAILLFISTTWPATFAVVRACIPENIKCPISSL
jgi:hypothetical protein